MNGNSKPAASALRSCKGRTAAVKGFTAAAFLAACLSIGLSGCFSEGADKVAGGGSETEYLTLTGKAALPNGSPAAGCRIAVRPAGWLYDPELPGGPGVRDTVTDAQGVWAFKTLPPGGYLVEGAYADTLGFAVRTMVDSGTIGIRADGILARNGSLTVRIDGKRADLDYYVQVYGIQRRALADSLGIAKVTLPPGSHRVRVIASPKDPVPVEFTQVLIRSGADTALPAVFLPPSQGKAPVSLIFDSNIGFAVDDAAALTLLHALADSGEARILAVGTTNPTFASPSVLDIIDTRHGRGGIPVGAWKGETPSDGNGYDRQVTSEFPHDLPPWDSVPEAATVYRRALEGQPDGSVAFVCTGDVRNAWSLLRASRDLAARKIRTLILVGGAYPSGKEFNFTAGIARDTLPDMIREVVEGWPTPIRFVGAETGQDMATGGCLASAAAGGPLKRIYDLALGAPNPIRGSTDLAAVLYAVRGAQSYWSLVPGANVIHDDGSNAWSPSPLTGQSYLLRNGGPEGVAAAVDSLLCAIPSP